MSHPYPPPRDKKGGRIGFTTGANAAAAAKAAALALLGERPEVVDIWLPAGWRQRFQVSRLEPKGDGFLAGLIKDAGDDPDVTHGAEIQAWVRFGSKDALEGGEGVGVVTRPGLGLPIGEPAINPVPRQMIWQAVREVTERPLRIVVSIPGGEELARKTLNPRLGVLGGLSVLGTTGVVKPYSTSAFRMSVVQAVGVARANGLLEIAATTGGRSERFAMRLLPHLPELAFIEMGDFVGDVLKAARKVGIEVVRIVGMIGKISKMADGKTMTHAAGGEVNRALLMELLRGAGASPRALKEAEGAPTARRFLEIALEEGLDRFFLDLVRLAQERLQAYIGPRPFVSVALTDFDEGRCLAAWPDREAYRG
ncbi:cobalamin biosynthesis protein CbiD (plasmid) [Thermus oshimai JL-2]|uniref:Cobalt-precorrin-5B C(1)-methyltransferase n=1 Tax=Thermus oshimai JL-2 TaxID=751945 RepID=K7R8D7_THEOS|nr:cobalt-precorrin-5B (C(1))-methyltransferase [Thermus oshimai]AFV77304.1 cobalamin biosynthesis protein CbiD [Thermus oshimai JL-2]